MAFVITPCDHDAGSVWGAGVSFLEDQIGRNTARRAAYAARTQMDGPDREHRPVRPRQDD